MYIRFDTITYSHTGQTGLIKKPNSSVVGITSDKFLSYSLSIQIISSVMARALTFIHQQWTKSPSTQGPKAAPVFPDSCVSRLSIQFVNCQVALHQLGKRTRFTWWHRGHVTDRLREHSPRNAGEKQLVSRYTMSLPTSALRPTRVPCRLRIRRMSLDGGRGLRTEPMRSFKNGSGLVNVTRMCAARQKTRQLCS